jgi:hypothetical protein
MADGHTESGPNDDAPKQANAGAVEATLQQLRSSLADEEKRGDTFGQRASWLLAFCGVILGLGASQGDELLSRSRDLGSVGRPLAAVALGVAVLAVAVAAGLSLWALFLARRRRSLTVLSLKEIEKATAADRLVETKTWHELREIRLLQKRIPSLRALNNDVAGRLFGGFVSLLVAIILFLAHVGVFVEDTIESRPCPHTRALLYRGSARPLDESALTRTYSLAVAGEPPRPPFEIELPDCPDTEPVPGLH